MSLLGTLFGRTTLPRSRDEDLVALSTAALTLETELGVTPSGEAGLVVRPLETEAYRDAAAELAKLLELAGRDTGSTVTERNDAYGYRWIVVDDDAIADLVSTAYSVAVELRDAGFEDQLFAAAFGFRDRDGRPVFWLYNFKRGAFYPFAPSPDGHSRDTAAELRLAAALSRELPVEADQTRWYPMWAMPLAGAPAAPPSPQREHNDADGEHRETVHDGDAGHRRHGC